jgi:hypothetical protein
MYFLHDKKKINFLFFLNDVYVTILIQLKKFGHILPMISYILLWKMWKMNQVRPSTWWHSNNSSWNMERTLILALSWSDGKFLPWRKEISKYVISTCSIYKGHGFLGNWMISSRNFFLAKFSQKRKFKIQKRSEFWRFSLDRSEGKKTKRKNHQEYRRMIKICTLLLILIRN